MTPKPCIYESKAGAARGLLCGIASGAIIWLAVVGGLRVVSWAMGNGVEPLEIVVSSVFVVLSAFCVVSGRSVAAPHNKYANYGLAAFCLLLVFVVLWPGGR